MVRKPLNSGDIFQTRHTSNIYQSEKVQSTSALKIFIMHCVRCNCHGHNSYQCHHYLENQPSNSFNQVRWTGVSQSVSVWKTRQWQQWHLRYGTNKKAGWLPLAKGRRHCLFHWSQLPNRIAAQYVKMMIIIILIMIMMNLIIRIMAMIIYHC